MTDARTQSSDTTFLQKVNSVRSIRAPKDQIFVKIRTFFDGNSMFNIKPYSGNSFGHGAIKGVEDNGTSRVLGVGSKARAKNWQNSTKNGRTKVRNILKRS